MMPSNPHPVHCAGCRDEAIPGTVRAIASGDRTADVELGAGAEVVTVALDLLDHVAVGDRVLVHQGFAIERVGRDYGRELYPFLYQGTGARDPAAVLAQVRASTLEKARAIVELRRRVVEEYLGGLLAAAEAIAAACRAGRKLIAFGNGGSATDADDAVADCVHPPFARWRPIPAIALTADVAVITAVANDVGFPHVFTRQLIAVADPGDIALGFSTSGNAANVLAAFAEARRRGMLTIGLSGGDGGGVAIPGAVDHCFVARSEHIPRIQEAHATIWHALLEQVQELLA
jgi:D-sedoheptulose 7-phosphate isomerase